jgi:hypothetical protein
MGTPTAHNRTVQFTLPLRGMDVGDEGDGDGGMEFLGEGEGAPWSSQRCAKIALSPMMNGAPTPDE